MAQKKTKKKTPQELLLCQTDGFCENTLDSIYVNSEVP